MTIEELKQLLNEEIETSDNYRANPEVLEDPDHEEGWNDCLYYIKSKLENKNA